MTCRWKSSIFFSLTVAVLAAGDGRAGRLDIAEWSHMAAVETGVAPAKGVIEFPLEPGVYDLARADLSDIRITGRADVEIGYVVRASAGTSSSTPVAVRLYNRTFVPGKQSSVTADFGGRILKNRIEVLTPGEDFRRKVMIEGSDDGESWRMVLQTAFLFKVDGGGGRPAYEKKEVPFPDNDQRYLRVTVYNGQDDPERVEIEDVRAMRTVSEPPETLPVPVAGTDRSENEREKATLVTLDLKYRHLPLYDLTLDFGDENFFRRVSVLGRNAATRIVKTPVEEAPAREKTVEEPWVAITSGVVYRYAGEAPADESRTVSLRGAKYRYLLVRIENADDPPLQFEGAAVRRLSERIDFQPRDGVPFTLYVGNADARRPGYDIVYTIDRLRAGGVQHAALSALRPNPMFGAPARPVPWSEKHKRLLWVALLLILMILGWLVFRQARSARAVERGSRGGPGDAG
jgi:hypothetical protein